MWGTPAKLEGCVRKCYELARKKIEEKKYSKAPHYESFKSFEKTDAQTGYTELNPTKNAKYIEFTKKVDSALKELLEYVRENNVKLTEPEISQMKEGAELFKYPGAYDNINSYRKLEEWKGLQKYYIDWRKKNQ